MKNKYFQISYYKKDDEPFGIALLDSNDEFIGNINEEDLENCFKTTNIFDLLDYTDADSILISTKIEDILNRFKEYGYDIDIEHVKHSDFVNIIKQNNGVEWYVLMRGI